ncbi:MAG: hypothetical protein F4X57_02305 [Chloroflexi bacterium]|nr:hypothetical protein [Chloroflexota bacterium]
MPAPASSSIEAACPKRSSSCATTRSCWGTSSADGCWQRCHTHFMTNSLTRVPKRAQPWVATMVRSIYQKDDHTHK